jgi:type IV pilus assembly protein PilW
MISTSIARRQHGLSLIELMVAIMLGAFLTVGVVNVFLSTKRSSTVENALARVQENGRLAVQLISADLHKAHYSGCNSVGGVVDIIALNASFEGVRGYEKSTAGVWAPDPANPTLNAFKTAARSGSDAINVQMADSLGRGMLAADVTSSDNEATLTGNPDCDIKKDDLLILSSCVTAHMLRVTNDVTCSNPASDLTVEFDTTGNLSLPIVPGYRYGDSSEIMKYESVSWYVADTGRDQYGEDVYALYRSVGGVAEEMVEGVEYLKIEFGQKIGSAMRYVKSTDADLDWDEVSTVRFAVLMQGFERVRSEDDTEPYNLLSTTIGASGSGAHSGGKVLRKVFGTTATLRNTPYDT